MNELKGIPTKTLQILWDNIHKEEGLIRNDMLQFLGKELMSRDDIEVGFKEKVEALS